VRTSRSVFGVGLEIASYMENVDKTMSAFEQDDRNFLNNNYDRQMFPPFTNYEQKLAFLVTHQTNVLTALESAQSELLLMLNSPHCK
jgi:hypothetical protein